MKKRFIILLTTTFILCGCAQQKDMAKPERAEPLPSMAEIHINCEEMPGEDYTDAKVTVSWGEDDAEPGLSDAQAEIKLRGNSSKDAVKKAYTIKLEEETAFLDMDSGRKWALISNPFDKSLIRPALGFAYASAMGIEGTPDIRLCQVWLNDRYMGVYTAAEPVESGDGRVGIDTENGDFLLERNLDRTEDDKTYVTSSHGFRFEVNEPEKIDEGTYEQCETLLRQAEEAIISQEHREYEKYIDVDSFVDFYIFNEMVKDIDFGEFSTRYYFRDGVLYAGPPWDLDLTMGNVSAEKDEEKYKNYNNSILEDEIDAIDFYGSSEGLWAYGKDYYAWLCQDPWFMDKVNKHWKEIREITENLAVDNDLGTSHIDRYMRAYEEDLAADFNMYSGQLHVSEWQEPVDTYMGNVEMLRRWLIMRIEYLDAEFERYDN